MGGGEQGGQTHPTFCSSHSPFLPLTLVVPTPLCYFYCFNTLHCCKMFLNFLQFLSPWESLFPPSLLPSCTPTPPSPFSWAPTPLSSFTKISAGHKQVDRVALLELKSEYPNLECYWLLLAVHSLLILT